MDTRARRRIKRPPNPIEPGLRVVSITTRYDPATLDDVDTLVNLGVYPNRSAAIETAVEELVARQQDVIAAARAALREADAANGRVADIRERVAAGA